MKCIACNGNGETRNCWLEYVPCECCQGTGAIIKEDNEDTETN